MSKVQSIKDWENELGVIFDDKNIDLSEKVDEAQFDKYRQTHTWVAVNIKDRTEWLKENGYEVTRENLINVDLRRKRDDDQS